MKPLSVTTQKSFGVLTLYETVYYVKQEGPKFQVYG